MAKEYEFAHNGGRIKFSDIRKQIINRVKFECAEKIAEITLEVANHFYGKKRQRILDDIKNHEIDFKKRKV
jgi:alpha/beta superfamily hydrolase